MNIVAHEFEYEKTGFFSKLILDYLNGNPKLRPFYRYPPDFERFEGILETLKQRQYDREMLVQTFERQYEGLDASELCRQHIGELRQANAFVVVTGHQTNLFMGPLYFFFKIISTINLSEQLQKAYPQHRFVPVYWMGSEDHDFAEINHVNLFGKRLEWQQNEGGATGRLATQSLTPVFERLKSILGEGENARRLYDLLHRSYLRQPTLATATRYLVNELFGVYGLLVLDQDDPRLKSVFSPILESELLRPQSHRLISKTNAALEAAGYHAQAHARPLNLFYLVEGKRERLQKLDKGNFALADGSAIFSEKQLLAELKMYPERFSPNVILRPLYQQCVLPALAYIGGGGELAYWMQLGALFEHYKLHFPMLLLRNSAMWINAGTLKKMQSAKLERKDLFRNTEKLVVEHVQSQSQNELNLFAEKEQIKCSFDAILKKALVIDTALESSVAAEASKLRKSLDKLESKLLRAEKRKYEIAANRIRAVKNRLFPDGGLQERHDNFIPFYLQYGNEFIASLKANLNPMVQKLLVLEEARTHHTNPY